MARSPSRPPAARRSRWPQARAAEAAQLAAAAAIASGPPAPGAPPNPALRCLLAPGRLYRLDIDLHWSGTLYSQDDKGQKQKVDSADDHATYGPAGAATLRHYYFRTAPVPEPVTGGASPASSFLVYGHAERLFELHRRQDLFRPEMLSRHLLGYEQAQSEVARSRDDPLRAHFGVAHAAGLAEAYPRSLLAAVMMRIRADRDRRDPKTGRIIFRAVNDVRAAICKACLVRDLRKQRGSEQENMLVQRGILSFRPRLEVNSP